MNTWLMTLRASAPLGVGRTDASGHWQFLGILPLYDPPRDDSAATIAEARRWKAVDLSHQNLPPQRCWHTNDPSYEQEQA